MNNFKKIEIKKKLFVKPQKERKKCIAWKPLTPTRRFQLLNTGCSKLMKWHPRIPGIIEFCKCPDLADSIIGYQLLK